VSAGLTPTWVVVVAPAHRPTAEDRRRGLSARVADRLRVSARALDPGAKTGNYMNNLLALHEAKHAGADDAILLNDAGDVTEATTSNVYLVVDGRVVTPALDAGILRGTTRTRILALAAAEGRPIEERRVGAAELRRASEIFLSSSVRGVLPVVTLDGAPVGTGAIGPVTERVIDAFEAAADREAAAARRGAR
jgi:branched-chain amino acid aminotransferase